MGVRVSFDRSEPFTDVMAANIALGTNFTVVDLAVYDMLCAVYNSMPHSTTVEEDRLSYNRYDAMSAHPLYRFFGWERRTASIEGVDLLDIVGSSTDKATIRIVLRNGDFNPDAAAYIRSVSWG